MARRSPPLNTSTPSRPSAPHIRDRIKELRRIKACDLVPHPQNWRTHPDRQKTLLREVLGQVGYADALLARQLPDGRLQLVDGHLRAETTPDQEVPVLVTDLSEEEARLVLLTLDPLASLAETNADHLSTLLDQTEAEGQLRAWLSERAETIGVFDIEAAGLPDLPTGDKEPFQQMTFTLSDRQAGLVRQALAKLQALGCDAPDNKNGNGNALAAIVEVYLALS